MYMYCVTSDPIAIAMLAPSPAAPVPAPPSLITPPISPPPGLPSPPAQQQPQPQKPVAPFRIKLLYKRPHPPSSSSDAPPPTEPQLSSIEQKSEIHSSLACGAAACGEAAGGVAAFDAEMVLAAQWLLLLKTDRPRTDYAKKNRTKLKASATAAGRSGMIRATTNSKQLQQRKRAANTACTYAFSTADDFVIDNDLQKKQQEEEEEKGSTRKRGKGNEIISRQSILYECDVCLKVFTTGQALGGHKRCHWNAAAAAAPLNPPPSTPARSPRRHVDLDLNWPPPLDI